MHFNFNLVFRRLLVMAQKRKRKILPKRPCPCCGSILSEKTIERHSSGTHVPTCITVTIASAAATQKRAKTECEPFDSGDKSDLEILDFHQSEDPGTGPMDALEQDHTGPSDAVNQVNDAKTGEIKKVIQNTWSGCRSRVEEYESDAEDEDFEDDVPQAMVDSDSDIDSEFEGEVMGIRDGLGIDELVDEDLQRIIAEFSPSSILLC